MDNLTGDASFNWLSTAAQQVLIQELTGEPGALALAAGTVSDAYLERASRLIQGYFDRRGGRLHFEISAEDLGRHKIPLTIVAEGDSLDALARVAKQLSPGARPFSTSNAEALAAWGQGDYRRAVAQDPDFGAGWLALVESAGASGDTAGALEAADQALRRPALRSPIQRAQIRLAAAILRRDDAERTAALQELAPLVPADATVARTLAEVEMNARRFPEAARAYRDAIRADPEGSMAYNLLGYAEALAKNMDAARRAFDEYGRRPGQATNALDSQGEAYFLNGDFGQAEQSFLQAFAQDPSFLEGEPLWKAAHARWLAGDLPGADKLAERYFERVRGPVLLLRRANWLYETGRRDQAAALLMKADSQEIAKRQLAVWSDPRAVPRDAAQLQQLYARTTPVQDGMVRTFYAAALLRDGKKEEARRLLTLWPLPERADSLFQGLLYPTFLELRKGQ